MRGRQLAFAQHPPRYAAKIRSRAIGLRNFINTAYKEDGPPDDEEKPEVRELLKKIETRIATEIKKRGLEDGQTVQTIMTAALTGLNIEALRTYEADKTKLEANVTKITGELEKVRALMATSGGNATQNRNAIRELLDKNWELIERAFESKEPSQQVKLNIRALVNPMTTGNTITETDIPDDLIESFSVDSFVKKRRPKEYIFNIASRRTVAGLTEYKTWLSEGTEDGAFAVVSQGAVKPLMSKTLIRNTTKYQKLAGKRVYTEEFAKFRKEAYGIIEDLFNDKLVRDYSALLTIDLIAKAAAYVGTALDGQYTNPTDYHAIGAVAAQIESLDFVPDILIINPQDKWRIGLEQNSQGSFFVNIPMYNPSGEVTMLGFPVFTTNRMAVGKFMLGEAGLFKVEDEPVSVRLGYGINVTTAVVSGTTVVTDVTSDVDTNRFRIIAETYYHDYIDSNHIGSFVYGDFAAIKEVLTAA